MSTTFHQVTRSLRRDHSKASAVFLVGSLLLLLAWTAWGLCARLNQLEISRSARIEVRSTPAAVQTTEQGTVEASLMQVGRLVEPGDILLQTEARTEELALAKEIANQSTLRPRIAAVQAQISVEQAGSGDDSSVLQQTSENSQAAIRQAQADAQWAAGERTRAEQLRADGIISEAEAQRARTQADAKRAALDALQHSLSRLGPEYNLRQRSRQAHIDDLIGQKAALEGELTTSQAEQARLSYEIERKKIRAPIAGRIAECLPLTPGMHLNTSQTVAVILPESDLHIVAEFDPQSAFGKIRRGQNASMRLDGFAWTEFGVVHAKVTDVAHEIRDGKVRVELAVADRRTGPPLQHGLPGSVEIETASISPLQLLLRAAGAATVVNP